MDQSCRLALVIALTPVLAFGCAPEDESDVVDAGFDGPEVLFTIPAHEAVDEDRHPVMELGFDDHLDGRSVSRSRFSLTSGAINMWLMTYYEPVDGVVKVWTSGSLRRNLTYELEIKEGLLGLDGEEVAPGRAMYFTTGEALTEPEPFVRYSYSSHVEPLLDSRCASCHGGSGPMAGLDLSSAEGVFSTASGVPAEGWSGWERVAPSKPGESYLMYKILGDERITGSPMPRSMDEEDPAPLDVDDQRMLSNWIAGGAALEDTAASEE